MNNGGKRQWPRFHWADLITLTGIVLAVNEAIFHSGPERPGLTFMFLAMMGVSPAARIDDRRHRRQLEQQERQEQQRRNPLRPPGRFDR